MTNLKTATTAVSALALAAGFAMATPAFADDHGMEAEAGAMTEAENDVEAAAEATGEAAEEAAEATEEAAEEAVEGAEEAAEETGEAVEEAAEAVEEAVEGEAGAAAE